MPKPWMARCAKVAGALAIAIALSGCIVVPGPQYGYYHRPHPFYYY